MRSFFIVALAVVQVALGNPVTQTTSKKISKDGNCGGFRGTTCLGSKFGNCCSQYGYCGKSTAYCGKGCNPLFGACSGLSKPSSVSSSRHSTSAATLTSSLTAPSSTLVVSTNARCGYLYNAKPGGMTCKGSQWGNCCSSQSYCGKTEAYCGTGCQPGFGDCSVASSSRDVSSSSSAISYSSTSLSSSSSFTNTPTPTSTPESTVTPTPSTSAIPTPTSTSESTATPTPSTSETSTIASTSTAPAVCKPTGVACAPGDTCCAGSCDASSFTSYNICCNPIDGYCSLDHPEGCCSGACLSLNDGSGINGRCF